MADAAPTPAPDWTPALARLALAWSALVALFGHDWAAMAGQWWNTSTYNHVLLVPPVLGWLVVQRWRVLAPLTPRPWLPGLVPFALALLVWALGQGGEVALVSELGALLMLPTALLVLLGPQVAWRLTFPLGYMLVMVPFGDELVPQLQLFTAHWVLVLLHLVGIPASGNGVLITTPAGLFKVAEACSGVKFLIAMIAWGVLAAHVCFRRWSRRVPFLLVCVVVPVVANVVRAGATIVVAGWRGMGFAGQFDHLVYGWFFFAAVLVLVMLAARPWFDRPAGALLYDGPVDPPAVPAAPASARAGRAALALLAVLAAGAVGWNTAAAVRAPLPERIDPSDVPGWVTTPLDGDWHPRHGGADRRLGLTWHDVAGDRVDMSFALYARSGGARKPAGFGEGAVPPDSGWVWQAPGPPIASWPSAVLHGPDGRTRLALTWYRRGALLTTSPVALRLALLGDRLRLRPAPVAVLIVAADDRLDHPAAAELARFVASMHDVAAWIDAGADPCDDAGNCPDPTDDD